MAWLTRNYENEHILHQLKEIKMAIDNLNTSIATLSSKVDAHLAAEAANQAAAVAAAVTAAESTSVPQTAVDAAQVAVDAISAKL